MGGERDHVIALPVSTVSVVVGRVGPSVVEVP